MSKKKLAAVLGFALALTTGTSMALTGEWDFTSGYDDENDVLVYGASETGTDEDGDPKATFDCSVADGTYEYEANEDGDVTSLEQNGSTVTYPGVTSTTAVAYGDTDGECDLRAVEVTNEQGVVNHGQVVSSFVHDLKEQGVEGGIGCLVRQVAQSDWGKGDEDAVVTTTTSPAGTVSGEVDLTSETVTCGRPDHAGPGGPDKADDEDAAEDEGDDKKGGPPEWAPGPPPWAGQGGGRPGG